MGTFVDQDRSFADFLALALRRASGATVAWIAGDRAAARDALACHPAVDVAVINFALPDGSGLDLVTDASGLGVDVIMVTTWDRPIYQAEAARHGAAATVSKAQPTRELVGAIDAVARRSVRS